MASSSSFPFTFRLEPPPPPASSQQNNFRYEQGRPLPLSREEKRRLREQKERDERELAEREEDIGGWYEQKKRGWGGMFSEEKEQDSREPPIKRRRGIATTLVDGVVSAALVGTAVGLTAFRMWRDRGKQLPPDEFPPRPPHHRAQLLAQPLESHVFAADHGTINHSLEGEERIDRSFSSLRSPPPSYRQEERIEDFITAPSTPAAIYPPPNTTSIFDLPPPPRPLSNSNILTRPPLLPSRSSFLPPAGLDSHIDNLNSKLSRMMEEARLALLSPIARFVEEEPPIPDDAVMVEEEVSDGGGWRNLDQGSSSGMRESWSMPSFPRPSDEVFAGAGGGGGGGFPRSTSTSSHRLPSAFKPSHSQTHRSRPSSSYSHNRQRSLTSNSTLSSSSTLSTPLRYRRDLLLPTSTSHSYADADVLFVSQEEEEGSYEDQEGEKSGQGSLAGMLESCYKSFGIDLGGTGEK